MNMYISHTSALELLASTNAKPLACTSSDRRRRVPRRDGAPLPSVGKATRADIEGLSSSGSAFLTRPVHLLVPNAKLRTRCATVRCHVRSGPFPARSFLPVAANAFSSSPELAFVQMAESLDQPRLVKLGDELCGTYGIETVGIVDFDRKTPFTTVDRLGSCSKRNACRDSKRREGPRASSRQNRLRPWKQPSSCCSACRQGSAGTACPVPR